MGAKGTPATVAVAKAKVEHRIHEIEHRLLPRAVRLIASGAVSADPGNPRVMRIEHGRGD